jgi:hypothetical protein
LVLGSTSLWDISHQRDKEKERGTRRRGRYKHIKPGDEKERDRKSECMYVSDYEYRICEEEIEQERERERERERENEKEVHYSLRRRTSKLLIIQCN